MEWNKIHHGDAVLHLKRLKDNSADCIIIDPPYNIGVDFGNSKYNTSVEEYSRWASTWISECERVLKDSGTMFIYGFSEILAHISVQLKLEHRWLVWHYTNKTVPSLHFWQRSHESILCVWKDRSQRIFHRDDVREPYTENYIRGYKNKDRVRTNTKGRFSKGGKETVYRVNDKGALPRDVIKISSLAGGAGSKERIGWCHDCNTSFFGKESKLHREHNYFKHPTQKPMQLTKRMLVSCMPKDSSGTVVIPFAGTGSECAVAKILGHDYIGFDLNKDYANMANEFLKSATKYTAEQ